MSAILIINAMCGRALAISTILENAGYEVLCATDAREAVTLTSTITPSLILVGKSKHHLFQEITTLKQVPTLQNVPIVLETSEFSLLNPDYRSRFDVTAVVNNLTSTKQLLDTVASYMAA